MNIFRIMMSKKQLTVPLNSLIDLFSSMIWQMVTNGAYRSIEHRATVNSIKERLSIATFYNPKLDGDMGPAPSLVTPQSPALFKRIGVAAYYRGLMERELYGKSYLEVMRTETIAGQNN